MELVESGVPDDADGAGVAAKPTEGIPRLNVEDVDGAGEVTSSEQARVGAEGGGGGCVGKGGGYGGLGLEG